MTLMSWQHFCLPSLQGYTQQSAQAELARVFAAQYQLTLTEEVEIRYRTETSTDPETGETTSEEVPYEYYILNVKLTSKPISAVASELLTRSRWKCIRFTDRPWAISRCCLAVVPLTRAIPRT